MTAPAPRTRRFAGVAVGVALVLFGGAAVVQGVAGLNAVDDGLKHEAVVGTPTMTPQAMAAAARTAGLHGVDVPTCSVAGKTIASGTDARCFAQYMRVDALIATRGKTYAQMPRFASEDGKGTNVEALALKDPAGRPVNNPARQVWVTETALTTALNTSYMAQQVSLFGIAVGAAFLLVGIALAALMLGGARMPTPAPAPLRRRGAVDPVPAA